MQAIGIHKEGDLLKIALLSQKKRKIEIIWTRTVSADCDVKQLYMPDTLLVSGLDSWEVMWRTLLLKLSKKREILATLPFQVESLFPFPLEEMVLLPFLHAPKEKITPITLCATSRKALFAHIEREEPDVVSCTPLALVRAAQFFFPDRGSLCLFHCGSEKSFCAVVIEKKMELFQTINLGRKHFLEALEKDNSSQKLEELPITALSADAFPHLAELASHFQKELERIWNFLKMKCSAPLPTEMFLSDAQALHAFFSPHFSLLELSEREGYHLPIGLAIDALYRDAQSIQFRRDDFASKKQLVRQKKQWGFYAAASTFLTVLVGGISHFGLAHKERILLQEYAKEGGSLEEALQNSSRDIAKNKIVFPYLLTAPKTSDLLAWISSHPLLAKEGIEIQHIHYSLSQYPQLGINTTPYLVKVDLEFTSASPRDARAFHDSLLRGEGPVNEKKEITWNVQENTYQTSFFLKRSGS